MRNFDVGARTFEITLEPLPPVGYKVSSCVFFSLCYYSQMTFLSRPILDRQQSATLVSSYDHEGRKWSMIDIGARCRCSTR